MAVIVQRMVPAEVSGVLFPADPVSGNRAITLVEAVPGLGDALVSGRVRPEAFRVRDGEVSGVGRLSPAQVLELAALGRRVEAHFGRPQDIEWCLAGGVFHVVQSRPITTLFPVPEVPGRRVYISVGHQQMMTDAMRPLGISLWQLSAARTMFEAGSRLFVDVTEALTRAGGRAGLMAMPGRSDPLLGDALRTLFGRDDLLPPMVDTVAETPAIAGYAAAPIAADPALVAELVALGDSAEPSEVTWLMVEPGAVPWHARWAALRSALGPNVPVASGTGSATIFLPDLHVQVAASNLRHGAFEQVSLRHPVARRAEVRALFTDALSVAGMRLVRSRRRMRTR